MGSGSMHRRDILSGALVAGLGLATSRVSAQSAPASELRIAQPWEFKTLNPSESGFTFTRAGVSETLVAYDADGKLEPTLAASWTVSDDGLVWRFTLRPAAFHDGSKLDAAAAKASFDRLLPKSLFLRRTGISAIEADGQVLIFKLEKPFGPLLSYLVDNSTAVLAPGAFDTSGNVTAVIGTGPYRIDSIDLPRAMTLTRHEEYWGAKGMVARIRYDAVANGDTRSNIAAANDADIVLNLTTPSVARATAAGMNVERLIIPRTHIVMLNCAKPQFADARARQALSLAIDRRGIAAGIMRNPQLAATQYLPSAVPEWHFPDLAPFRQDVAAANALLDAAGWTRGSDGVRAKEGVRFAGTIRTFPNRPELPIIASAMQAQFKAVGFDLAISVGEWQAIYEGQKDGSLDLGLSSRNLVVVPEPIGTIGLDYADDTIPPGGSGTTGWRHDGVRRDVAEYMRTLDDDRRKALRRSIAGVIHEELPIIPIVWYDQIIATHPRISGFTNDPLEQRYFLNRVRISS